MFTPDHNGPDGRGRNRFRLEISEPRRRCTLRPSDPVTIWTAANRPTHREAMNYGPCTAPACHGCPVNAPPRIVLRHAARVTEDEQAVTLHTEPPEVFSSWAQFYRAVACELGMVRRDESGWHYPAYPVERHAEP